MAEGVLFSTAEGIANRLVSLIGQEIRLIWGVKDELQKLGDTVSTIQAVLLDAEEQQVMSHAVKYWLRKLKDAMDDAEDLLDDFSAEVLRREVMTKNSKVKEVSIFFSKSNQLVYGLEMGHRIKALRERLNAIAANRHQFHFTERYAETHFEFRERDHTHSFVPEKEVIGRENDKKAIIELLMDCNVRENVSIIPIVGIGGLGKTTIAQYVYGDEEVKRHFDLKMWVCVSEPFNTKAIVEKIIESATKKSPENLEMDSLQSRLRGEIDGKKYLLVLDDVWNEDLERWISLKNLLMGGLRGSKILITTRSLKVAEITSTILLYELKGLSEESSWKLFKKMAFKEEDVVKPELVEMGREIVRKCAHVPLAIRTIGTLLRVKNSIADWLYFKNCELSKINPEDDGIFPVLKLSYDYLPSKLKQCLAFCSLFPKDYEIEVEELIRLWVAEGFIQSSNGEKSLEDIGREFFMHLLWRSFFQDIKIDLTGNIYMCKMHDLMHDLAQLVAGDECKIENAIAENIVERTRHVALELDFLLDIPTPLLKANKLRTFLLPHQPRDKVVLNSSVIATLISNFKCLRVLNLRNSNIQIVPNSIGKLKHLRYLNLSRNDKIQVLPSSITQLLCLQTLILDWCMWLKELPEDTRNLVNLRHLGLVGCYNLTYMPNGLKELKSLQTLSLFILQEDKGINRKRKGGLSELNGLNGLRGALCIKGLKHLRSFPQEAKNANLKAKQFLEDLKLEWEVEARIDSDKAIVNDELLLENLQPQSKLSSLSIFGYTGVRLSSWLSSLSNLISIEFSFCKWCECIPPLDKFPFLQSLHLSRLTSLEYISNSCSDICAPSLKRLFLAHLSNLKGWCKMQELIATKHEQHYHHLLLPSFPSLEDLFMKNCPKISRLSVMMTTPALASGTVPSSSSFSILPKLKELNIVQMEKLESLPEWIGNLTSLRDLWIVGCPNVMSLPETIGHLTSLRRLLIEDCPELKKRCEKEIGEDWLKVAHVQDLDLK